jgi:hypothetical protein
MTDVPSQCALLVQNDDGGALQNRQTTMLARVRLEQRRRRRERVRRRW